jgi:hypothetical protein
MLLALSVALVLQHHPDLCFSVLTGALAQFINPTAAFSRFNATNVLTSEQTGTTFKFGRPCSDNTFVYFPPSSKTPPAGTTTAPLTSIIRYRVSQPFNSVSSWEYAPGVNPNGAAFGACHTVTLRNGSTSIFFYPTTSAESGLQDGYTTPANSYILVYDTAKPFNNVASWTAFSIGTKQLSKSIANLIPTIASTGVTRGDTSLIYAIAPNATNSGVSQSGTGTTLVSYNPNTGTPNEDTALDVYTIPAALTNNKVVQWRRLFGNNNHLYFVVYSFGF